MGGSGSGQEILEGVRSGRGRHKEGCAEKSAHAFKPPRVFGMGFPRCQSVNQVGWPKVSHPISPG